MTRKDENLLGIDYGEANIGLAFGAAGLTMPIETLPSKNLGTALTRISRVVIENRITKVVVGLPVLAGGKSTPQTLAVKSFIKKLKSCVKVPVETVEEFQSSKEALKKAIGEGYSMKGRKSLHSMSAQIILRRYYETIS
ncbi:Holliday junction resolvase RuvX [candidate division WWE3 bacterium]|nr:Holliday junction resolvase RuvX [candidate division WWE3 bacterium]